MEDSLEEIEERHKQEIKEFQNACPHNKTTWMPKMALPGGYLGEVKLCLRCKKELEMVGPEYQEELTFTSNVLNEDDFDYINNGELI